MFIEIKDLTFGHNSQKNIISDISFSLERGKSLAIVGASGSGKSTLLRLVSGIWPEKKGNFLSGNISVDNKTPNDYRKFGKTSFMFQKATLLRNLSVRENVEFPLKVKKSSDFENVNTLLKLVGLEEFSNYLPKQLSGGMEARVALARSFVSYPELLLLDEPFSDLDIAWKSELYLELGKLIELSNTTTVIVTHDEREAVLLADHVIVLNSLGNIEFKIDLVTNYSILERINNMSEYLNIVHANYTLPIQNAIIRGKKRKDEK